MGASWKDLDRILRGEATRPAALRRGAIEVPAVGLTGMLTVLGMAYGACMGTFALMRDGGPSLLQLAATTLKVPALFLLTLVVTFPSLYVFNALVGSRLTPASVGRLLLAALAVTMAVLASLGPIVAFFSASTTSYAFMVLLNVAVFAVSGGLGMAFLLQTLHRLDRARPRPPALEAPPVAAPEPVEEIDLEKSDEEPGADPGPLDHEGDRVLERHVRTVFRCWIVLFGLVGAQMAWVLRPFLGDPNQPFTPFRPRGSNFFEAVWNALASLLS